MHPSQSPWAQGQDDRFKIRALSKISEEKKQRKAPDAHIQTSFKLFLLDE